jgi:hypothetical protein
MSQVNHAKVELSAGRSQKYKTLTATALLTRTIWLGRKNALHKAKETANTVVFSAECAEIRHYHSNPQDLPVFDRHHC